MKKSYDFTSDRLGFRNWEEADAKPFVQMNQDPAVMEFFPSMFEPERSMELIQRLQGQYKENGFTFYATDLLETGEFLGFVGLLRTSFEAHFTPCVEIGWRLRKEVWGRGLAPEGALACLEHGFGSLGLDEVYSFAPALNKRSERVMQKIGMEKVGEFEHPKIPQGHPLQTCVLYLIKNSNGQK